MINLDKTCKEDFKVPSQQQTQSDESNPKKMTVSTIFKSFFSLYLQQHI
jgi:hypothetical protein